MFGVWSRVGLKSLVISGSDDRGSVKGRIENWPHPLLFLGYPPTNSQSQHLRLPSELLLGISPIWLFANISGVGRAFVIAYAHQPHDLLGPDWFRVVTHSFAGINAPAIQSASFFSPYCSSFFLYQKLSHTRGGQPRITPRLHPVSTNWIAPNCFILEENIIFEHVSNTIVFFACSCVCCIVLTFDDFEFLSNKNACIQKRCLYVQFVGLVAATGSEAFFCSGRGYSVSPPGLIAKG